MIEPTSEETDTVVVTVQSANRRWEIAETQRRRRLDVGATDGEVGGGRGKMLVRVLVASTLGTLVAGSSSGRAEGEGFGQQTWLSRCLADATNGKCMTDVTAAQFLDPENTGADAALDGLSSGPSSTPYATYPFRSNDGLRSGESTYVAKFRGRMHSSAGVPHRDTAEPIYGRGGTNQLPDGQTAATGGADAGFNNFNQPGSFTTLDTMYQRPTASYPADREKVLAGDASYSGPEHGLFRCTADANTAWSAGSLEIGGVTYNPPLQGKHCFCCALPSKQGGLLMTVGAVCTGGSARFMMQTIDFAEGTNC